MFKNSGRAKVMKIFSKDILLLIFLATVFLIYEIGSIKFPGPETDEAGVACEAMSIKQSLSGQSFIRAMLNHQLPLMRGYHGALDVYVLISIFSIFPIGVESMRMTAIFFGIVTIFLTYFFIARFLNKKYALFSVFLLIIHPGFIIGTKSGMHYATIMNALALGILSCLLKWYLSKRNKYFYLAMFMLGLGMWTRIQFFWFVFGVFLTAVVFRNKIRQRFEISSTRKFLGYSILGIVFFLLGSSIILYNECTTDFSTFRTIWECLKNPISGQNLNNLLYFRNLFEVIGNNFRNILTSGYYFGFAFQDTSNKFINNLYPWLFLTSIVYLSAFVAIKKNHPLRKRILFLLLLFVGMFILTPISVSYLPVFHLYFFYPFIQIIVSMAIVTSLQHFKRLKLIVLAIVLFFILFMVNELNALKGYFNHMEESGGKQYYSAAIYDLTEYLVNNKISSVVLSHYGPRNSIKLVSGGLIQEKGCDSVKDWGTFIREKNVFIFYSKEPMDCTDKFSNLGNFLINAERLDLDEHEIRRFYERDGSPVYSVYTVIDPKNKK